MTSAVGRRSDVPMMPGRGLSLASEKQPRTAPAAILQDPGALVFLILSGGEKISLRQYSNWVRFSRAIRWLLAVEGNVREKIHLVKNQFITN